MLIYKCMKNIGLKSISRHYKYKKSKEGHIIYKNEIAGNWNASKPYEIVVSDMTQIHSHGKAYELTLFVDAFNNEIIAQSINSRKGDIKPYYDCLSQFLNKSKEVDYPTIIHTDQRTVYSSKAFNQVL